MNALRGNAVFFGDVDQQGGLERALARLLQTIQLRVRFRVTGGDKLHSHGIVVVIHAFVSVVVDHVLVVHRDGVDVPAAENAAYQTKNVSNDIHL
jgi:hypothetical protein